MEPDRLPNRLGRCWADCPPGQGLCRGLLPPCGPGPGPNAVYTVLLDEPLWGREPPAPLHQQGPIHCSGPPGAEEELPLVLNGRRPEERWGLTSPLSSWPEEAEWEQNRLLQSPYIPVPRHRHPVPGKAGLDEVMAAAVLTSLSTSPLVLGPPTAPFGTEPCCEPWKEGPVVSSSYGSSNNSGDWGWDPPSDQSTPSTPSPPLPPEAGRSLLSCAEETEAAHFLFGDPIPRKRKNSVKVMFKCLWKNCGKVLSTSSGIQKHIRTMHLGRRAEPEQSDGEEDFYYTELDINMDSLTDGLSSLTPMSPTSSAPPVFPGQELPAPLQPEALPVSPLSPLAPTSLCHIHTDHAYQAVAPVGLPVAPAPPGGMALSIWQPSPPPGLFNESAGCLAPVRPIGLGDKRLLIPHPSVIKSPAPAASSGPRPAMGSRKPRGEAKKCRKVYGMENRDMWCTACRWKKACQRFLD
ncbi:SLC2A4 regulator [Tachyglossus aculeatus]|uniref:SLC2A4 regulator n=1 Tax=Tachyglossus aculeatus TaxID=9261 RepID=UPI0018F54C08|nr:SLC2A4 regulator [Tachyglossus aculeatus]